MNKHQHDKRIININNKKLIVVSFRCCWPTASHLSENYDKHKDDIEK